MVDYKHLPSGLAFQEGMKLEAIDPLNLSEICAATVKQVRKPSLYDIDTYCLTNSVKIFFFFLGHSCERWNHWHVLSFCERKRRAVFYLKLLLCVAECFTHT